MKVLVTGANGQLGYDILRVLKEQGVDVIGTDRDTLDITNQSSVHDFVQSHQFTHIIHCAAYTAVDQAEEEKELCYRVNRDGTRYLAETAQEIQATMIYFSTDYVFQGQASEPYDEMAKVDPINVYGASKLAGEKAIAEILSQYFILRISWVFGSHGNNFVKTMLRLSESRTDINVVADQIGSPTYTYDVAELMIKVLESTAYGIYHVTNEGYVSWANFSREIFRLAKKKVQVVSIPSSEYPTKANRPLNSRLSKNKLRHTFGSLPTWQHALASCLEELKNSNS